MALVVCTMFAGDAFQHCRIACAALAIETKDPLRLTHFAMVLTTSIVAMLKAVNSECRQWRHFAFEPDFLGSDITEVFPARRLHPSCCNREDKCSAEYSPIKKYPHDLGLQLIKADTACNRECMKVS
jgi:hypothetical protein